MLDYRAKSVADITKTISGFRKTEEKREEILNGLLRVAVWHSIKDGQITPAQSLLASVHGQKERVSLYLTKYGNLSYSDKKGLHYNKTKGKVQYGLDKANEVFEELPDLGDAFPSKPKQYRDMPFISAIKHILKRAEEVREHGKSVVFATHEEEELFKEMQALVVKVG